MIEAKVQKILQDVILIFETTLRLPSGKLDGDVNFEDIGIDSIISMELMNSISKKFNISLSPASFTNVTSLRELAELLCKTLDEDTVDENVLEDAVPEVTRKDVPDKNQLDNGFHSNRQPHHIGNGKSKLSRKTSNSKVGQESYQELLHYIKAKYEVDLSYMTFSSIDEIINTLVVNHSDDLLPHFNSSDHASDEMNELINQIEGERLSGINGASAQLEKAHDIAIVGISCNFPDAPNTQTFWENLINEKSSIREIPTSRWDWKHFYEESASPGKTVSKWGALLNDIDCFDPQFFSVDPEEAKLIDPQERLLMQEVYKAFQDAGIAPAKLKGTDTGIYVAYEYSEYEKFLRDNIDKIPVGKFGPVFTSSSPTYYLANRLSFLLDFHGPSESVNVNCAGSAVAINRAYYSLVNNESSVAVVGGVSLNLFANDYISLSQYGILSPNGTCGVFDDNANGFTRGEGVAAVILKRLDDAKRDNNRIYGVIKASHQNNRGSAGFLSEIKHESITSAISACYEKSEISPDSINYIEVDGYATKWGDSFEFEGVKNVFKGYKSNEKKCALGSVKGNIGNLEAVSGLAGFIKLALSLYHKKFPKTISNKKISSFIDIDNPSHPLYIANKELAFDTLRKNNNIPVRAGLNSFADSGVNLHIVLEEYLAQPPVSKAEATSSSQLFILSAKDPERLKEYILTYIDYISTAGDDFSFSNMIYTLQVGRDSMDERLAVIAASHSELLEKLNLVKDLDMTRGLGLEKKGIFNGNINHNKENPIISILSKDMISAVVEQCLEGEQWQQIAQLWASGFSIDWETVWINKKAHPISLPAYPFAKTRYWVDIQGVEETAVAAKIPSDRSIDKSSATEAASQPQMQPEWYFFMSDGDTTENATMGAEEKIMLFFKHEIALQLNKPIQQIEEDVNFLELGLNSIGLLAIVAQVNDLLQINLSPALLFNYSDVKKLTKYLAENYSGQIKNVSVTKDRENVNKAVRSANALSEEAADNESGQLGHILVPMQTKGEQQPIFAVPGADGNVIILQHLVSALGEKQPFYGLEAVGLGGKTAPLNSVEEIAKANIEAIKVIQATGPYRLLGFSNGGMIAYEMARILLGQNEKIESLILLDCLSPSQPVAPMVDDLIEGIKSIFINSSGQSLHLDAEQLKHIPESEIVEYIYDNVKELGFNFPKEQLAASINLTIANDKCCRAYKPSKLPAEIEVLLLKASEGYTDAYKNAVEDYGWNKLLVKPVSIYSINANHFSIIDKDNSTKVAKKINAHFSEISPKKASAKKKGASKKISVKKK